MIFRSIKNALAPLFGVPTINVRVRLAQTCSPDQVPAVLSAAALRCSCAVQAPAPEITFEEIGENALVFSVTLAIRDIKQARHAESELRTEIVKATRDAGIALAKPQLDVHLRDLDGVRAFLLRLSQERARHQQQAHVASNDDIKNQEK